MDAPMLVEVEGIAAIAAGSRHSLLLSGSRVSIGDVLEIDTVNM